jgi:hypothetical protein
MKKLLALLLFSATLSAENVTERPPFIKNTVPQNTMSNKFYFAEMRSLLELLLFSATLSDEGVIERPPFVKNAAHQNTIEGRFVFAEECLNDYYDLIRVKPKIDTLKLTKIIVSLKVDSCDPIIVEYFKR